MDECARSVHTPSKLHALHVWYTDFLPPMPTEETRPMDSGDGKPSTNGFSEDGRGGTKPIPEVNPGRRYIYYRLYTKDGPLESNHPIYSNDRFISRIASTLVRPPQTAASLTRYLCKIEGLEHRKSGLYQSLSDNTALDDSTRLSFRGTPGPGPSDVNPVALIVDTSAAESRSQAASSVESKKLLEWDYEPRYVYYRVYDYDGGAVSKMAFKEDDPSLGRVNTLSVPPPHTVSSLKNFIIRSEGISGHNVQLFEDEDSESAMNDNDAFTLLSDAFPGFIEDQPIGITYESGTTDADKEDPNEIQFRELREALAQIKQELEEANLTHARELEETNRKHARELAEVREGWEKPKETHEQEINEARSAICRPQLGIPSSFTKKLEGQIDEDFSSDTRWHSVKTGEIFYTDGISRKEKYKNSWGSEYNCYLAANSSGKLAFVGEAWTKFS